MLDEAQKSALRVLADVYIQQGQADKAVVLLRALGVLMPGDSRILGALSFALLTSGRHEEVLNTVDEFLRLGVAVRDSAPILLIRSRALWALGRESEARETLDRYLELSRGSA